MRKASVCIVMLVVFGLSRAANGGEIAVRSATYGASGGSCDAKATIAERCDTLEKCRVASSNQLCGAPAPGQMKVLTVRYACSGDATVREASADEDLLVELDCSGGRRPLKTAESQETIDRKGDQEIIVTVPSGAEVVLVRGFAREKSGPWKGCLQENNHCYIDWASFQGTYSQSATSGGTVISWTFHNESNDRTRVARVTVQYR